MANIRRLFSIRKRSKESYQEGENKTDVAARQPTPTSAANFDASKLNGPTRSTKKTNISSARPSRSSSKQVARKSSNQDSPGPMEKPVVPKRAAQHRVPNGQARYDRKMRRRQMKKELEELLEQGEACETSQVLAFLETYQHEIELLGDVLSQLPYVSRDTFPLAMIWQFNSAPSLESTNQQLAARELLMDLMRQRDALADQLPDPLVMQEETTEQGPQFALLTPQEVQRHIEELLGRPLPDIQITGAFPFTHQGDYPLQLDFSHRVTLPVILRLEARPDPLPEDCAQDFQAVSPLTLPLSSSVLAFLQDYLAATSPNHVLVYGDCLREVLVTAYHYGYGRTPWVQDLLHEWRSKRGEYFLLQGLGAIKEAMERIVHEQTWQLPEEFISGPLSEDQMQELATEWLAQDPVLSQYNLEVVVEQPSHDEAIYLITTKWKGVSAGTVEIHRATVQSVQQKTAVKEATINIAEQQRLQGPDTILNKVLFALPSSGNTAQHSLVLQEFHTFIKQLKREVLEDAPALPQSYSLPTSLAHLVAETKKYPSQQERAEHYLALARAYSEQGNEPFTRYALAEYCFWRGWQRFIVIKKDARPYLQAFLLLHSQMAAEGQRNFVNSLYRAQAFYFSSYTFTVDIRGGLATDVGDRFYSELLITLASIRKGQYEALGRCVIEIGAVHPWSMADLVNRMKTRGDSQYLQQIIAPALQEARVFRTDPFTCLYLLARINPSTIASAFTRQSLSTAEERRRVVSALLKFTSTPNTPAPSVLFNGFAASASTDTRIVLAFSLLVEPFVLGAPAKESELKATLIAESLGLPAGIAATEYFLSKAQELSQLFDRFLGNQDPNVKGRYAISIFDTIRLSRRRLIEHLREDVSERALRESLGDVILQFFRRVESYVTAEHAKLIHDTTLELVLVSDRTLHSPRQTRLTVEIRNVGEGIADHLVLEMFPVPGKYTVEERHRLHRIDTLADKTPIQKELFIQPLVEADAYIELSLQLRYDTLKKKDKVAELPTSNRTVWLYPESQFVRVRQPYNPGVPATTWFYGRKNQLESMADNLRTGDEADTSMIVYGLKRAGKTSVVRRFIGHTLQARGLHEIHIPIYVDLLKNSRANSISSNGEFLSFLLDIIVRALSRRQLALPSNLDIVQQEFQNRPLEAFEGHLEAILHTLGNQRLLLVLDEFSTLYQKVAPTTGEKMLTAQMFGFLSNTIQGTHQLTFIFTGTYMLLEMMRTYMYDLAKICKPLMITFLDDASARQLIMEPVQRDSSDLSVGWLEYDPRVVDLIVTYTHCHPYLIQYICMQLVERMNELKYHRVNLNDLDAIVTDILMKPSHETAMLNLWNEFGTVQHKVLSIIAALSSTNQRGVEISEIASTFQELGEMIPLDEVSTICESLADAELLEKTTSPAEQSEPYQITIPLYQMWLKQNKPPRTVFGQRSIESPSYQ